MFWIISLLLIIVLMVIYFKFFKRIKVKNLIFIDGTLGTGKSRLSVCMAVRQWKANCRKVAFKNFFRVLRHKEKIEQPLLYSNINLAGVPFVPLTVDLLTRKNYRFAYGSVLLIDEISLVADQMSFKDKEVSERLSEFFKLFRHETKGGYCFVNSQSISDCHYSLKYCLNDYIYIHSAMNLKPLGFSILRLQERTYNADNSSVTMQEEDIESTLKYVCVLNKWFKYYDSYCYSIFTDDLPVYKKLHFNEKRRLFKKGDSLKKKDIISIKPLLYIYENLEKGDKKDDK